MVIKEILKRRSVRDYENNSVSNETIHEIIKAAQFAPTAMNNRSVEYVLITDQKIKDKIFTLAVLEQAYIKTAPVLIIPVVDIEKSMAQVEDLSIASTHIMLQATAFDLGTVWKYIAPETMLKIAEVINLPKGFRFINIIPLGFAKDEISPHTDDEFFKEKIHNEKW